VVSALIASAGVTATASAAVWPAVVLLFLMPFLYYAAGWHAHWATKNLWNGLCTFSEMACGALVVLPSLDSVASIGVLQLSAAVAVMVTLTVQVQDLRDIQGDVVLRRRTMPIVMGEMATRVSFAIGLAASCAAWPTVLMTYMQGISALSIQVFSACHWAFGVALAFRTMRLQGAEHDSATYYQYVAFAALFWCGGPLLLKAISGALGLA
jgi:1,4-dihydroxy-2-naphthoate octaprenyltransferase